MKSSSVKEELDDKLPKNSNDEQLKNQYQKYFQISKNGKIRLGKENCLI